MGTLRIPDRPNNGAGQKRSDPPGRIRYGQLKRTLRLLMGAVAVLPLLITVALSFFQYRSLLEREAQERAVSKAESAKRTLETFLSELQSVMVLVSRSHSYDSMIHPGGLESVFNRVSDQYGWLVDLGVIDSDGVQHRYVGPYDLEEKIYTGQKWYEEAYGRQRYLSNVFMGFRHVPHFVMTVSSRLPDGKYWTLRASIDAATLKEYIETVKYDTSTDMFVMDDEGTLQTSSLFFGEIGSKYPVKVHVPLKGMAVEIDKESSPPEIRVFAHLEGTPWTLALVRRGYVYEKNWVAFKNQIVTILAISILVALVIIYRLTGALVDRIKESDRRREALLSEMEHTSKLASIGRLAAGIAHEINNPLAIINEKNGLMRDIVEMGEPCVPREKILALIDGSLDAVKRSKTITHRLLGFARRMDVTRELFSVNDVIREVAGFIEREALYRGIRLGFELSETLPPIESDRGQLQQILLNIFNNAIDAVEKDGSIVVTSSLRDDQFLRISIKDSGPGIPPGILKNVFEPFFTTKPVGERGGTGLGLSITYGLVKKLGGDIVASSPPEGGAVFTVDLPLRHNAEREDQA